MKTNAEVQQPLVSKEEVPPEQQQWSPRLDQEDPPELPLFTETDGEDPGGPEPARNFNSDSNLQPVIHDQTSLSSERENNECCDWEENWEEPLQKHKGTQTLVSCSVPEPPHIKEEQEELWTSQEGEQLPGLEEADITKFPFTPVPVKSEENYEEKPQSSQLHQNQTEENRGAERLKTETDGEDCGAQEPARNFNPDSLLQPATHETKDISDWEENLEEHLPKRNGIQTVLKAFSCSVCKKTFQWRADAVRHMRVHTGEKPFSCSVCGNRFARKDRLRQHLTVHTGERPFRCNICGKTFTRLYIVKNHECVGKRIRNK
ncbi:gastrula zinc finger protein XlCGF48.2-like [Micropterus dolomieu]|uniref:gastrula zinc finger protein XlCGF48.2-like n=1 Tax=Micropterus dolomieu TaxID=147949 RepID=UPI001E8EDE2D|nr:gastrula zinc finger protein XlCGF48.2-like [Micropterus dolomieu]